jgi:hypothetical protein
VATLLKEAASRGGLRQIKEDSCEATPPIKHSLSRYIESVYNALKSLHFSIAYKQQRNNMMGSITASIVAAISAEAIGGLTEAGKTALTDAYAKDRLLEIFCLK